MTFGLKRTVLDGLNHSIIEVMKWFDLSIGACRRCNGVRLLGVALTSGDVKPRGEGENLFGNGYQ